MTTNLRVGDVFPNFELPDHRNEDGYLLILIFGRGFFCPRDQQHMRQLMQFQSGLAVNFGKLATVSTDAPLTGAAFAPGWERSGLSYPTRAGKSSGA